MGTSARTYQLWNIRPNDLASQSERWEVLPLREIHWRLRQTGLDSLKGEFDEVLAGGEGDFLPMD